MSLLSDAMEQCTIIDKRTSPDGYGGVITTYVEGATFKAAIVLDTSTQAKIAEKAGVTSLYTITTNRGVNLQYHDVFTRASNGAVFRVTSEGTDKKTPPSAGLDMRQVSAEKWELPKE